MAESNFLLSAKDISASYGGAAVISGVELTLCPGDHIAIVGANGSGKSTLLRALSGLLPLRSGSVDIRGHDLMRNPERAKAGLGYAVDAPDLPVDLTGSQYLELVASIKKCSPRGWFGGDMIAPLQFEPWLPVMIGTYSLGTKMKLSIMAALLGAPPVVILDESLNGLDPLMLHRVRTRLTAMRESGHGVIASTHMINVIAPDCTQIMLIAQGTCAHRWAGAELRTAQGQPGGVEAMIIENLTQAASANQRGFFLPS
jgi:ABC-2 type transport system ATP-binding protein